MNVTPQCPSGRISTRCFHALAWGAVVFQPGSLRTITTHCKGNHLLNRKRKKFMKNFHGCIKEKFKEVFDSWWGILGNMWIDWNKGIYTKLRSSGIGVGTPPPLSHSFRGCLLSFPLSFLCYTGTGRCDPTVPAQNPWSNMASLALTRKSSSNVILKGGP